MTLSTMLSAITMFDEPCTVTAQQLPSALMVLPVPMTISVDSLQSIVWLMPCPVMWVSPFLACAQGTPTPRTTGAAITHAASERPTAFEVMQGAYFGHRRSWQWFARVAFVDRAG